MPTPQSAHTKTDSLGAAAAAAATTPAKAANGPALPGTDGSAPLNTGEPQKKTRKPRGTSTRKVFVVEGKVHTFDSKSQAEKFLNSDEAPEDFVVMVGTSTKPGKKVSLR